MAAPRACMSIFTHARTHTLTHALGAASARALHTGSRHAAAAFGSNAVSMTAPRAAAAASWMDASVLATPQRSVTHNSVGKLVRSSVSGLRATIFGAYGFLGRYVTALVAGSGTQCVIPFRGDDMEWRHLKVNGDLGVVAPMPYHPHDIDSIRRAMEGSDIVINLIGKDYETKHYLPWLINSSFEDVHVRVPETLAKVAVEMGVTNFIHVSALAADPYGISAFARSKAKGEEAVRAIAPGATIIRPSDIFGPEDRFLNLFARMYQFFPRIPLVEGGTARVQPVYVQDVAQGIFKVAMSEDPEYMLGQTYDFAGPEEYTHREVAEYVFETIRATNPEVANVSPAVADAIGSVVGLFPAPIITRDRFLRMQSDVVLDETAPTKRLHDLGLEATSMEMPGFTWLHRYRSGSHLLDLKEKA